MNKVRIAGWIGVGMLLALALMLGVGAAWAQGPMWSPNNMMGGASMMGKNGNMTAMHAQMHRGDMTAMHAQMHHGEAMPEACQTMMSDPAMMEEMMTHMQRGTPMSLEEASKWMTEHDIPADVQAQCLAHMAEHHPDAGATPAP